MACFVDLLAQCTPFFRTQLAGSSGLVGRDLLRRGSFAAAFFLALLLQFAAQRFALILALLLARRVIRFAFVAPARISEGTHRSRYEQERYTDSVECHFHRQFVPGCLVANGPHVHCSVDNQVYAPSSNTKTTFR